MKLILYSGGEREDNEDLHFELINLTVKSRPSITFIPSSSEERDGEIDYRDYMREMSYYGIKDIHYFPVDRPATKAEIADAYSRDIIYLSGGNTFYFLYQIKKNGHFSRLKEFVSNGGILSGLSAGSIIMTNNIHTAHFPDFDCDINEIGLKNFKGLNLVNFEFFPHYLDQKRYQVALSDYSVGLGATPLYACPDGSGIVINGNHVTFIGDVYAFVHGVKFKI